jgi:hypothetical protein
VLLIEATRPMSTVPSFAAWEPMILDLGYLFAWFDGLNRFYVRREDAELLTHFKVPPNVFDGYVLADRKSARDLIGALVRRGRRRWSRR